MMVDVPTRPRRTRRPLLTTVLIIAVLAGLVATGAFVVSERLGNNVRRIPLTFTTEQQALRPPASAALTFLAVAVDSAQRLTDTVSIVQLAPDRESAAVIALPTDATVEVPGSGPGSIRSAFSPSDPTTLIRTVEGLTGQRIDHIAVIDLDRLGPVVDAVGGVEIKGTGPLDGRAAAAFAAEPDSATGGTTDARQRQLFHAVLNKATSTGLAHDPIALYHLVDATSRAVTLDDGLSNVDLGSIAFSLRDLQAGDVTVLDAPVTVAGTQDPTLDSARDAELWQALRSGTTAAYADLHPDDVPAAPAG